MINCLCLKNAWPDLHETKSSVNELVDLFRIWLRPLTLPLTLTMNFQGQILKLPYLWNIGLDRKKKENNKRRWILWMVWYFVNNIWPTFYFHRMLQCRSGLTFLSLLGTSSWAYPCRNGDGVYLGHNTCLVPCLASLHIHTAHVWNSLFCRWQGHKYGIHYDRIYYSCLTIFEMQTGWRRVELTEIIRYDLGQKWNIVYEYSIV